MAIRLLSMSSLVQVLEERTCLPDVSIGSLPNANSAGTFLSRAGEEREGEGVREEGSNKKTNKHGMLMAHLTCDFFLFILLVIHVHYSSIFILMS